MKIFISFHRYWWLYLRSFFSEKSFGTSFHFHLRLCIEKEIKIKSLHQIQDLQSYHYFRWGWRWPQESQRIPSKGHFSKLSYWAWNLPLGTGVAHICLLRERSWAYFLVYGLRLQKYAVRFFPWLWPFKVTQGRMWYCHWILHLGCPIHICSNCMSISHHLAVIATQNVYSNLLSLGPN